jgi:DNA-binding response OmpR family regulator
MAEPVLPRILLVDDDPDIARLVQHVLTVSGFGAAVQVTTGRDALASLNGIDIVLLDHQLPDASGLEVLGAIRAQPSPPAIVLVTAHGNESLAAAALRLGADDYLAKDTALAELLPQIHGFSEQRRQGLENIRQALRRIRDIVQRIGGLREVRSKDYLRGVRMLDLEPGEEAAPAHRGTALVHLPDEDLVRIVSLLLRDAGFEVRRVHSVDELNSDASNIGVSLVVVAGGATMPGAHPLGGFVPAAARDYLLVALVTGGEAAALSAGADHVVHLPFDPETFTAEIVRLQARQLRDL